MAEPNGVAMPQGKPQYPFNGINSNNSSRGASPVPRTAPIPPSQLPPARVGIPSSQLPPSRGPVGGITQKVSQLSVSGQNTPNLSPNKFSASTPNQGGPPQAVFSENVSNNVSPIVPINNLVPSTDIFNRNTMAPQTSNSVPSINSNTFMGNSSQTSQYFNQSLPFDIQLNGPLNQKPTFPTNPISNNAGNYIPSQQQNRVVRNTPGQNTFGPQPSQPSTMPSTLAAPNYPSQMNSNYSTAPQINQPATSQRPRYPQTLPPNPSPTPHMPPPQYNPALPPRVSPHPSTASQPPPSQRFNPQINYNVGPTPPSSQPNHPPNTNNAPSRPGLTSNRYPTAPPPQPQQSSGIQHLYSAQPQGGVVQTGFNRLWGAEHHDLLQLPNILPPTKIEPPRINLGQEQLNRVNCSAEVFRPTMTKIPETASLLQKSRLPLGFLIHPFKDLSELPVIQSNVIVRCRTCRTYINPFVYFVDTKRWKCNLCYRVNELPEDFLYDPFTQTYGDPSRRPEVKSSTIEYVAPAEYMLRPPQPAVYLYLLDVSRLAVESGYLEIFCNVLLEEIKNIPGDARTQIGFLAYDSTLHFFSLAEGLNQPHEMTVLDIDDVFLPTHDNLLVNLKDRMEMVEDLLGLLPQRFANTFDGNSALGAALQVAFKMMSATGGRVSVFQAALPNIGPGAVTAREDPNQRATAETPLLNPANDFYKRLALECSGQQVAVDMFVVNSQYVDLATISGISKFSGGSVYHYPLFKHNRLVLVDTFQRDLRRYLTRKIGFEAVMRIRCTRGLTVHTFHGNFFVRSTDLLSLPNINPDSGYGMQVAIEENMSDVQTVAFQAALLYTSSKGERRIRVHTLCLPVANTLQDIINSADQQCIVGLLGKMAVDRSTQASLSDAREAFINAAVDVLSAYKFSLNMGNASTGLLAPDCLKLLPLYIAAILKHPAFRIGIPTRLDDRVKAMLDMKTLPLSILIRQIYPDLYPIHNLDLQEAIQNGEEDDLVPQPPRLQLSARCLENKGAYLLDCGTHMIILVGPNVSREFLNDALGVADVNSIVEDTLDIPELDNKFNQRLRQFIDYLNRDCAHSVTVQVIRDNSPNRVVFFEKLIEDRLENSLSYHEFLQHLKTQVK